MSTDTEKELVLAWVDAMRDAGKGDHELEALLIEAYCVREFHRESNGCNLVNELRWPHPRHPACVVHDLLYKDKRGRRYSDRMMRKLNKYFGRPFRGWLRWAGLRIGGWYAYHYGE